MGRNASPTKLWPILSVWETMRPPMQVLPLKGRRPMKDQLLSGIAEIIFGAHFCSGFSQAGSQWDPVGGDW